MYPLNRLFRTFYPSVITSNVYTLKKMSKPEREKKMRYKDCNFHYRIFFDYYYCCFFRIQRYVYFLYGWEEELLYCLFTIF